MTWAIEDPACRRAGAYMCPHGKDLWRSVSFRMAHVLVRRANGEWVEVRGTALKIPGRGRYKIIVTSDVGMFVGKTAEGLRARVNGLEAREVAWVIAPEDSATRGYVS